MVRFFGCASERQKHALVRAGLQTVRGPLLSNKTSRKGRKMRIQAVILSVSEGSRSFDMDHTHVNFLDFSQQFRYKQDQHQEGPSRMDWQPAWKRQRCQETKVSMCERISKDSFRFFI